jgi:stage II sporulation protein D
VVFCAPFLVPNPPIAHRSRTGGPDSALTLATRPPVPKTGEPPLVGDDPGACDTNPPPANPSPLTAPFGTGATLRIALARSTRHIVLTSADTVILRAASAGAAAALSGRIVITLRRPGAALVRAGAASGFDAALPCTLLSRRETAAIAFNGHRYRGSMVLTGTGSMLLLNCVAMEDYLRGVVPLEMGRRSWQELEALKAQAVASRTYACKHRAARRGQPFDVYGTIADQVYGGADAENAEADSAIGSTRGMVVRYGDSLADIYYHSTCGGHTAAFDEAWNKPACPYLQSQSDLDPDGKPYCAFSPLFDWQESWSADELTAIIGRNIGKMQPGEHFSGTLRRIRVVDRFPSGRVRGCRLEGKGGNIESGGDNVRFILRRNAGSGALLRSSNFSIIENGPDRFTLRGRGYGHGVGMCQMGAVGRARSGQTFDRILKAYFAGTEISRID